MAKAMTIAGTIIGTVASVLPGPWQPFAIAASLALNIGGALLQKKPPVLGSVTNVRIGANNPSLYPIGRTFVPGTLVHDVGYGSAIKSVPNPNRSMVFIGNAAGPSEALEAFQADFTTVPLLGAAVGNQPAGGYYNQFIWVTRQLGACPEAGALAGPFGAIPKWGAGHKLSGKTAWMVTLRDDKEGKKFSSGIPAFGWVGRWAKVYDCRQDSTYPGGAGACRAGFEASYVGGAAAENPSCHGATYAVGRWQGLANNKKLVIGVGLARPDVPAASPAEAVASIDWPAWAEFANVCDANGWKVGGIIEEPTGLPWDNLKRICGAGGAQPAWVGGKLTVLFPRPRVPLDTIRLADLAEGSASVRFRRPVKDRQNILIPKIRLESHKWQETQLAPIRALDLITADGEEKSEEYPIELVQQEDQAAELTRYALYDAREKGPFTLPCKVRMFDFKTGDALVLGEDLLAQIDPEDVHGLAGTPVVIVGRRIDPATATVELTLVTDRPEKHAKALGSVGVAPPAPSLVTGEDLDAAASSLTIAEITDRINTSSQVGLSITATDTLITLSDHGRRYSDMQVPVLGGTVGTFGPSKEHWLYCEDPERDGVLSVLPALENRLLRSEQFSDPAWVKFTAGTAAAVIADAAVAPDGKQTADRINFPAVSAGSVALLAQFATLPAEASVLSFWFRGAVGGERFWLFADPGGRPLIECVLTTSWQRFTAAVPAGTPGNYYVVLGVRDTEYPAGLPAQSVFVWGAQLNRGLAAFDYRRTGADAYPYFPPNRYRSTTDYFEAFPSPANPFRHYAGYVTSAATGGTGTTGGGSLPPGGGGSNPYEHTP